MLSDDTFLGVVAATPLVSVDLVVLRHASEILLGQRTNRPAQGFWFVPGGRIRKNETIQSALTRVAQQELGLSILALPQAPRLMGAFDHFYADCFAGSEQQMGISTHYVALGHLLPVPAHFALPSVDKQHAELRWWSLDQALNCASVHPLTKLYIDAYLLLKK